MLAIRNFGHFWNRDLVDWGKRGPGARGKLSGYPPKGRPPFVVDFREQMGIYVLHTIARDVVYIGQAGLGDKRLFERLRDHTRNHLRDRWQHFFWFGLREVNQNSSLSEHQKPDSRCAGTNLLALDEIEAVLIQLFEPRLNKQGSKWGENCQEYFQYVPWEWEEVPAPLTAADKIIVDKIDVMSNRLQEKIESLDL